jgi:hypothetical protein
MRIVPVAFLLVLTSACCGGGSQPPIEERFMEIEVVPKAPEGPTGEDADWLRTNAPRGQGHCGTDEIVLFHCGVEGDKQLSLCGSATLATVQYRFGPPGAPELIYPDDSSRTALTYGHEAWARGEEHSVSFTRGEHTYRVVDASGSGIDGEANNYQGVKVFEGDEEIAFVACTTAASTELMRAESILGGTP